jgi:hypothetical protein
MLHPQALIELMNKRFTRTAFRLETLPAYEVASDRHSVEGVQLSDFERYLAGEPEPLWERKRPWLDTLAREREEGRYRYRVRILGGQHGLTDYERYSCEWGYDLNSRAGEGIFIIDRAQQAPPSGIADHDFWLINDELPIRMHYASDGQFEGATIEPSLLQLYQESRNAAMGVATPFAGWWPLRPEYHRTHRPVA